MLDSQTEAVVASNGCIAFQCRAMSMRRATHTRSWRSHVVEKALQRRMRPGRPSSRQCMPIDIIAGRSVAFGVEHVERVAQVLEELVAVVEALRHREPHVVGVQRVGHDQMRRCAPSVASHLHPERQVVAVVVGVVLEAAVLGHQPARVRAVAPVYQPSGRCRSAAR